MYLKLTQTFIRDFRKHVSTLFLNRPIIYLHINVLQHQMYLYYKLWCFIDL